jgi:hypothetical protein
VLHFNFAFYVYFWLVKILSSNMSNCLFGLTSIHGDFTPSISSCQLGQWIPGGANLDLAIEYFIILMEGPGSGLLAPNAPCMVIPFPVLTHSFPCLLTAPTVLSQLVLPIKLEIRFPKVHSYRQPNYYSPRKLMLLLLDPTQSLFPVPVLLHLKTYSSVQ